MELVAHNIRVLDTTIHYYTCGKGPQLLFIHGHRADSLRYKGVISYLARFFQVFSPDLPGFGKSPALKSWHTMENLAKYVIAFSKKLALKNFTLSGFSMGSIIAIHVAKELEPELRRIILLGTPFDKRYFKIPPWKQKLMFKSFSFIAQNRLLLFIADKIQKNNKIMQYLIKRQLPKDKRVKEIIDYEVHFWQIMPIKIWLEATADLLQSNFAKKNIKIKTSTLLIETPHDHLLQVEKNLAALKKTFPNHQVIFTPLRRHVPYGDFNEDFVSSLASQFEGYLKPA